MSTVLPARAEVPLEETYNAESVYASPKDWERDYTVVQQHTEKLARFEGKLASSAELLLDFLLYLDSLRTDFDRLRIYAAMNYAVDAGDEDAGTQYAKLMNLSGQLNEATAFVKPELLQVEPLTLGKWLEHPQLSEYRHYFDELERSRPHVRSEEVETLLGGLSSIFAGVPIANSTLANSELDFGNATDSDGQAHPISQSTIRGLLASPDRSLRQSAYENYADAHLNVKKTAGNLLATGIKQTVFTTKARRYDSALHMALVDKNIPLDVFHTLIDTFKENLPTWHRYWRAKRKALGVTTLRPFDVHAPLVKQPEVSYEQSCAWLAEAMAPLGKRYVGTMNKGLLEQRWVDRSINQGKRMGAFSIRAAGTHPFIMMSYTPDLLGMSTLAHEIGHSMHSYFTEKTQPRVYHDYSLFVAEVASNFNQAVLRDYLFKQDKGRDFELALIDEAMANFYRYFFVMPTLARFELEVHTRAERGEALSASNFSDLLRDLFAEGYGDEVEMDDARVGITWAQFHTHMYSRFYVYQYATGISGAHALAKPVSNGDTDAAERYVNFLKAGSSSYALDALKDAGVDLAKPGAVKETFAELTGLVERLEALA